MNLSPDKVVRVEKVANYLTMKVQVLGVIAQLHESRIIKKNKNKSGLDKSKSRIINHKKEAKNQTNNHRSLIHASEIINAQETAQEAVIEKTTKEISQI